MMKLSPRTTRFVLFAALLVLFSGSVLWSRHRAESKAAAGTLRPLFEIPPTAHRSYSTRFTSAERPISEGGRWISGAKAGADWDDVVTVPGLAYGTETGDEPEPALYDDSTALLSGDWDPDQTVEAEVHSAHPTERDFEEVELRLRSSFSPHRADGYEVLFRCLKTGNAYASIVRWNGKLGDFTYLLQKQGPQFGVGEGDVVKAAIVDETITAYINGVAVLQVRDGVIKSGNPGMGFWLRRGSTRKFWIRKGMDSDFGFTRFAAWN